MSIFSTAETGTKVYRSRFNLSHRKIFDCFPGEIIPAMAKFVLPGDVWKAGANILIRCQPMVSPTLTRSWAKMRYFFVPLRLVESNTEKIITGSQDGQLIDTSTSPLPTFPNIFANASDYVIEKNSLCDYFGFPPGDYTSMRNNECMPARYWITSYLRSIWDYYLDENIRGNSATNFEVYAGMFTSSPVGRRSCEYVQLHKDYFTSSLLWQLKGVAPTFDVSGGSVQFTGNFFTNVSDASGNLLALTNTNSNLPFNSKNSTASEIETANNKLLTALGSNIVGGGSFTMDDIRTMAAQTRLFERLARCGSRYTEYLKSNFNTSPADGTLQRAQYLGGFSIPIVNTEVVQTAADGDHPVGTLRGHGISSGGNTIKPFIAKEFGVILGLFDIMPEIQYTQGIDREFTYKSRFDFFNPSFQHLSEQEVRNGELFINADGKNDNTFGFQAIYNELRTSRDMVVGDLRDSQSYWTQAIKFTSRPNLNNAFLSSSYHKSSFMRCFAVTDSRPYIVDCGNLLDVYRPMVKYGTPGLIDHL